MASDRFTPPTPDEIQELRETMRDYRGILAALRSEFPTSSETHANRVTAQLNAHTCPICGLRGDYHTGPAH